MKESPLRLSIERPNSEAAQHLISALDADLRTHYPDHRIHGLHPGDADDPRLIFVIARVESQPVGCGALRHLDADVGEIKRMYIAPTFRRLGYSRQILAFLESSARNTGYSVLRLETGTEQPESIGLYRSCGYREIPCYGEYVGNPFSLCFEKRIQ